MTTAEKITLILHFEYEFFKVIEKRQLKFWKHVLINFDKFVLRIAETLFSHSRKLTQTGAGFNTFFQVVTVSGIVNHIGTSLIYRQNIC